MDAETALRQSEDNSIESDVRGGFVGIFLCEKNPENFHLYFKPYAGNEFFDCLETVKIGIYDDLDTAVTIACIGYGAYEARWIPSRTKRF